MGAPAPYGFDNSFKAEVAASTPAIIGVAAIGTTAVVAIPAAYSSALPVAATHQEVVNNAIQFAYGIAPGPGGPYDNMKENISWIGGMGAAWLFEQ